MADRLGIALSSLAEYETDKSDPRPNVLMNICKVLNTTPNYLYGFTETSTTSVRPVPVLGVIRAGLPLLAEENWDEQITVGQFEHGADFALRVTGDSMAYAGIREGDYVLLQQADKAETGQIVAAMLQDGDALATLKYYIDGRPPILRAANPRYADQPMTYNHRIIGVFCGLVRTEEPTIRDYQAMLNVAEELDAEWESLITEATSAGIKAEELKALLDMMKKARK